MKASEMRKLSPAELDAKLIELKDALPASHKPAR